VVPKKRSQRNKNERPASGEGSILSTPPIFDADFLERLEDLFIWRRDVRHFKTDTIDEELLEKLLKVTCLHSPSVGNSQPWRYVKITDPVRRDKVKKDFEAQNQQALENYHGDKARLYASLKLAGLTDAPVHLAVFADIETERGAGLGQATMPETLKYSVANSIYTFWLAARAYGVGVGWVSIIDPPSVTKILDVPENWELIGYLCVGYPKEENETPELLRVGWQDQGAFDTFIFER